MKRALIFALLLILGFSICGNVYAQIDITIGNGTATSGSIDPPTPYGTYWENFRQQYLVLASEIVAAEGAPGNINSVGFNVQNLHNCSPMQSFTIRLKHTTQTSLSSNFELGDYQTVFEQDSFMPVVGWNVHNFIAPFVWNGSSNILVDVMTSRVPYSQNASVYYSTTTFNSSLRFQSDTTEASGQFTLPDVFASQTYTYVAAATGFQSFTGQVVVETTNLNMGDIVVNEIAYPPFGVVATENAAATQMNVTWQAPNPNAVNITEGFEGNTFPPAAWTQVITNTGPPGNVGVLPTWCRVGAIATDPPAVPQGGEHQAGLWWVEAHQDEWLITPQFICPESASVNFWSYVFLGSTNGDHYYVNVSTNNGSTWTQLWDASAETGGWNHYNTPISVDLGAYAGQPIKIAWQAEDPPSDDGLWYSWFIDEVSIGSRGQTITFQASEFSTRSAAGEGFAAQHNVKPGLPASRAMAANPLPKITQIGTITGVVLNHQHAAIMGATVTCGTVIATTNSSGAYTMQVQAGTHSVTASAASYSPATQTGVIVVTGATTNVNFRLYPIQELLVDGFESYPNFSIDFAPWTLVDVDQSETFGFTNVAWETAYTAQAFIIMNPSATVPPVSDAGATPHGGSKYAACFASEMAPNNDWMITPVQTDPYEIRFWAKSFTADYGLERMKVGVSTTGTYPASFTIISGANYIQVPDVWTEYSYMLSNYPGYVYVGIQCVSNDAFFLMVDDVRLTGITANEDPNVPVVATELHGNYPNPFNPETTISYSVKESSPVTIEIYNVKGQIVKTLVNENKASGNYSVVWNGRDNNQQAVSSGVYFYKMNAGKYSSTKKMILMK